jgi:PilZ domain
VKSPFQDNSRFLVIPQDVEKDFCPCAGFVRSHSGSGAWLYPESSEQPFPNLTDLLLIEFQGEVVFTHYVKALNRKDDELFVSLPHKTEKEKSLLAPSTGRYDYRIEVNLPVRVKTEWVEAKDAPPKLARLTNLSRGGMALLAPLNQDYRPGQEITVRVVGWDHPVRIEAIVERIRPMEGRRRKRIALKFPDDIDVAQREMISSFILQVQRREALGRALPTTDDDGDF